LWSHQIKEERRGCTFGPTAKLGHNEVLRKIGISISRLFAWSERGDCQFPITPVAP
jgi:hypothetical protein